MHVPQTQQPMHQLLHQAEIETLHLHSAGRALRAVADLTRRSSTSEPDHLQAARRDDVACLMEVLGESIIQRASMVDRIVNHAARDLTHQ